MARLFVRYSSSDDVDLSVAKSLGYGIVGEIVVSCHFCGKRWCHRVFRVYSVDGGRYYVAVIGSRFGCQPVTVARTINGLMRKVKKIAPHYLCHLVPRG